MQIESEENSFIIETIQDVFTPPSSGTGQQNTVIIPTESSLANKRYFINKKYNDEHLVQLVRMSQLVRPLLLLSLGRPTRMRNEMLSMVDKVALSYKPKVAGTVDKVALDCQDPLLLAQPKDTLEFLLIPHGRAHPHQLMKHTFPSIER